MPSSPEYTFFNASLDPGQRPLCDEIRELLGMINGEVRLAEVKGGDEPDDVIAVDAGVCSAHSQLVQTPMESELQAQEFPSGCECETAPAIETERRLNVGEFRRILVAEHDRSTRLALQRRLQEWGFEVITVKNGVDALSILKRQRRPELAILSRRLPGIDGLELCRRISDRIREFPPYIFILGNPNEKQEIESTLEAGAADYLTAPVEESELRARLIVASRILKRQQNLISSRDEFRVQARNDSLTGVWNRRAILEVLEDELDRSSRHERSTGVLLVDLDHFKRVNDLHGHLVGDLVLQETSRRLSHALRSYDFIGRYGGEEFLIVVPGANQSELCELAERIRAAMECEPVLAGQNKIRITLSIGATIATAGEKSTSNVIAIADAALYKAKRIGRNRTAYGTWSSNGIFKTRLSLTPITAS